MSPQNPPITDAVLAQARRGDADAVGVVWTELAPAVAAYLRARGVSEPDDVTSEVFLALLPRLADLRGGVGGLRTLVFSIAHARVVDDTRRRVRRPAVVEFDDQRHDRTVESAEQQALGRFGPAGALLAELSPNHREVLALRVVADLDLEQTAAVMGRSVGSVKQLQRRALLALRARVDAAAQLTGELS
jgi:RNA polymerase sigma-70 factor, ECF subfamily